MNYQISANDLSAFNEQMKELEELLTERISDFYQVKGLVQARHAYVFYRRLLTEAKYKLQESLKEVKGK